MPLIQGLRLWRIRAFRLAGRDINIDGFEYDPRLEIVIRVFSVKRT